MNTLIFLELFLCAAAVGAGLGFGAFLMIRVMDLTELWMLTRKPNDFDDDTPTGY